MKEDLKTILDISYGYCKNSDETIADLFRKINDSAHKALKYAKRHPEKNTHWTEKHYKNYHMS
jgi:RNA polymerase-binding transcription factor DksA